MRRRTARSRRAASWPCGDASSLALRFSRARYLRSGRTAPAMPWRSLFPFGSRLRAGEWSEVPEVLHLQRAGVTLELAGEAEESQVALRTPAASIDGDRACRNALLEVGNDVRLELLGQIRQEVVLPAELGD